MKQDKNCIIPKVKEEDMKMQDEMSSSKPLSKPPSQLAPQCQLLMVGDIFQSIFGYNGSSDAYLREPEVWFGPYCKQAHFVAHVFRTCYRITHEMAAFINTHCHPKFLKYAITKDPDWWAKHGSFLLETWGDGIKADPKRGPAPGSVKWFFEFLRSELPRESTANATTAVATKLRGTQTEPTPWRSQERPL